LTRARINPASTGVRARIVASSRAKAIPAANLCPATWLVAASSFNSPSINALTLP
jgi:hypothetical protein